MMKIKVGAFDPLAASVPACSPRAAGGLAGRAFLAVPENGMVTFRSLRRREPLAQEVEHLPFKQRVAGSNPARLTF